MGQDGGISEGGRVCGAGESARWQCRQPPGMRARRGARAQGGDINAGRDSD